MVRFAMENQWESLILFLMHCQLCLSIVAIQIKRIMHRQTKRLTDRQTDHWTDQWTDVPFERDT